MMRRYLSLLFIFITIVNAQQRANNQRRPVNTQQRSVTQRPTVKAPMQAKTGSLSSMRDLDFEVVKLSYIQNRSGFSYIEDHGLCCGGV